MKTTTKQQEEKILVRQLNADTGHDRDQPEYKKWTVCHVEDGYPAFTDSNQYRIFDTRDEAVKFIAKSGFTAVDDYDTELSTSEQIKSEFDSMYLSALRNTAELIDSETKHWDDDYRDENLNKLIAEFTDCIPEFDEIMANHRNDYGIHDLINELDSEYSRKMRDELHEHYAD